MKMRLGSIMDLISEDDDIEIVIKGVGHISGENILLGGIIKENVMKYEVEQIMATNSMISIVVEDIEE